MIKERLLPEIPDSHAVLGMTGSGFSAIDTPTLRIRYKLNGNWREDDAPIIKHTDEQLEIALPISKQVAHGFELTDIGYYENGDLISLSRSFFLATKYPYRPFGARNYALNLSQKFDGHPGPMGPHSQAEGIRRYAGGMQGVGSLPDLVNMEGSMGYLQRPWRNLRVGYGPVQEYGSMGYGSMGDGSMSMAVQTAMRQRTRKAKLP